LLRRLEVAGVEYRRQIDPRRPGHAVAAQGGPESGRSLGGPGPAAVDPHPGVVGASDQADRTGLGRIQTDPGGKSRRPPVLRPGRPHQVRDGNAQRASFSRARLRSRTPTEYERRDSEDRLAVSSSTALIFPVYRPYAGPV